MRRLALLALLPLLTACGDDTPYSCRVMREAENQCDVSMVAGTITGEGSASRLDCLRGSLPKMSDDQLNRFDYWLEKAKEENGGYCF